MISIKACAEAELLEKIPRQLEECLARDIPDLDKMLRRLQVRCRRGQPVDRGIKRLELALHDALQRAALRRDGLPKPDFPQSLPIVERRDDILELIAQNQVVVVCGETGSGKTTQLPKLCLQLGRASRGMIAHTQPRRLAARALAGRIAEELHCTLGRQVGFKVRFHDRVSDATYVKVMTDGMLLAEIQSDPDLRHYDTLIIDEAHERSLNIDFLLGYIKRLLIRRPDLKVVITSATIDPERFSEHFDKAPVIEVSGRAYPVEVRYRPLRGEDEDQRQRNREQAILEAVDELAKEGPGDVLVFLPGERAIKEAAEQLRKHHPPHTEILALYARLSAAQQSRIFRSHKGRRIVLATNVAETSLTVPGIHYVVDTGLARISRYNYRTKVQRLPIEAISQASADQRAGRCGRVAAGICIRLYSEDDYQLRPLYTDAEIKRTNLAAVILQMASLGLGDIAEFPFIDPPDPRYIRDGNRLLQELGAIDGDFRLTQLGRKLSRLSVDPRLARMVLAGHDYDCLQEILIVVSALEIADPRERPLEHAQAADEKHALFKDSRSDFLAFINLWREYRAQARHLSQNKLRQWCRQHFVSYMRMREWHDIHRQLQAQVHDMGLTSNETPADYRAIHTALLTGLLGNIAFQAEPGEFTGARNLKFVLFPGSGLSKKKPKWLMASELLETGRRYLRTVAAIEPAWVEAVAGHLVKRGYEDPHWELKRAQVVAYERVTLYGLALVRNRKVNYGRIDPAESRRLFIQHALVRGEFQTQEAFALYNRELLAELERLEAKSRRRDLLADEADVYAFFDERIPQQVVDGASFGRWWKHKVREQPDLLSLDRRRMMQHSAASVTDQQYPDNVEVHGVALNAHYHFSPGEEHDGLCIRIPLAMLNQVRKEDFEWLVPGMLLEKCTLLIKSLPKPLRKNFVPAPDFAKACLQASEVRHGRLTDFLADNLQRMTGVTIPGDAWGVDSLPSYLSALFEVIDGQGRVLERGRNLTLLKKRYAAQAHDDFSTATGFDCERRDVQDWDFGALPERVSVEKDGLQLSAYPALCVSDGRIDVRVFDQAEFAKKAHCEGLLALFRKRAGRALKEIKRAVPDFSKQALWFSSMGSADALLKDIEQAVLNTVFLHGDCSIRDAAAFMARLNSGRPHIVEVAVDIGEQCARILEGYHQLQRNLKTVKSPQLLPSALDVRQQLEKLVYPGFVSATPGQWLQHVPRYLHAARLRLELLPGNQARDRQYMSLINAWWERYEKLAPTRRGSSDLMKFRWLIEELRVSLYAQSLGTSEKVSPQRLERVWQSLNRA